MWGIITTVPGAWLAEIGRSFRRIFNRKIVELSEETYAADWKDYYKILGIPPGSTSLKVIIAYRQMVHLFDNSISETARNSSLYLEMFNNIKEAYQVLINRKRRKVYDQLYTAKAISMQAKDPMTREIVQISGVMDDYLKTRQSQGQPRRWHLPVELRRVIIILAAAAVLAVFSGTSFAMAQPSNEISKIFKYPAIFTLRTGHHIIELFEVVRATAANYERNIIQTAVNSMRVIDNIEVIRPTTEYTNDMAAFPSLQNPVFPQYLDKRFSQYRYTINEFGILEVDASTATTARLLRNITSIIRELESE